MSRLFQIFAYASLVIIGGIMIGFKFDGHIIVICIACNSFILNLIAVVAIVTGGIGLTGTLAAKKATVSTR